MKMGAILTLILVLSLFGHLTQASGAPEPSPKVCHEKMTLPGKCGKDGALDCLDKFVFKYAASQMPRHVTCTDVAGHRLCECDITCW